MTKEETVERINVMQAYVDGKEIEFFNTTRDVWEKIKIEPAWAPATRYRVKPEKKYRPFKNAEEAFTEAKKHGFWVKDESGNYRQICYIYDKGAEIANEYVNSYTYDDILSFVWADTSEPCGILEE